MNHQFFVTCPKGIEPLLWQELSDLGLSGKQTTAGVSAKGGLEVGYKICLWSRLANRVFLELDSFPATDPAQLYRGIDRIDWLKHLHPTGTLAVDFSGQNEKINHSVFGAQKVKDAIVDQVRAKTQRRPSVNKVNPDVRINVRLQKDIATVSVDLSGQSLHERGYRLQTGKAPLKENLAAALLVRSQWPSLAEKGGFLLDPLCGSGTLLIEGCLMAAGIAPGLMHSEFGFSRWRQHQAKVWQALVAEAQAQKEQALQKPLPVFQGYDQDPQQIEFARENAKRAGVENYIQFEVRSVEQLEKRADSTGLILCNPPYGERLQEESPDEWTALYQTLGKKLQLFVGSKAGIFTGNEALCAKIGIRPERHYKFFNGALPCKLFIYALEPENFF